MSAAAAVLNIALILLLAAAGVSILWRAASTRRVPVFLCLFLILPGGQLLMLYSFSFETWSVYWLSGLLLGLAANILLLVYTISQEKKIAAIEDLRETRHRIELEKSHYEAVERRREELDSMRVDFSGKLDAVAGLIRTGEDKTARESISTLAEKLSRTKENPYCAVPVINAVLTKIENDCAAAGIALSVDLNFPHTLAVEPMHLCSIFSNILDNAIAACRKTPGADKPVIRLSSITDGDYLIVKTTNPSDKPGRKPATGHGYGLRILSELAARYGGDFQCFYREGVFATLVSLLAAPEGERTWAL
ncbi:MAG: ATP-binding protein [Oscillospiraceae bacterium]|nr:ATP-binding protein [Oscillospiraceae bacterium]